MTYPDVSPDEMKKLTNITESELDAMRSGQVAYSDPRLGAIAEFVNDIGDAFPEPSTTGCEEAHVAAMLHAAHLMADKGEPVARPVSKANGPVIQASGLPKPRRENLLHRVFATKGAAVVGCVTALILAFSGVAMAGALPRPVQNAVADAVRVVGVDLPGGATKATMPTLRQSMPVGAGAGEDDTGSFTDIRSAHTTSGAPATPAGTKGKTKSNDATHQSGQDGDKSGSDGASKKEDAEKRAPSDSTDGGHEQDDKKTTIDTQDESHPDVDSGDSAPSDTTDDPGGPND